MVDMFQLKIENGARWQHLPAIRQLRKENLKFEEKTTVDKGKLLGWQQHNLWLMNVVNLELEWQETIHEVPGNWFFPRETKNRQSPCPLVISSAMLLIANFLLE